MDQFLRRHLWVANLVTIGLVAYFLASGTGSLLSLLLLGGATAEAAPAIRPGPRRPRSKTAPVQHRSGRTICVKNVFNYKLRPCADDFAMENENEEEDQEDESGGVPPYCEGGATLVATFASDEPDWAFALIKNDGKTMPYRVGASVEGLGKIKRVGWRLVLVDAESGPDCLLDLYPPAEKTASASSRRPRVASAQKSERPSRRRRGRLPPELQKQIDEGIEVVSATERAIDRGLVDSLIENSSALMSQARVLPYERDGVVQGFKLYGIRRNSLLGKLGLRNGDIINSIGGIEMTSPDRALEAYTKLRNASSITIEFTRRGRRQTMDYSIR